MTSESKSISGWLNMYMGDIAHYINGRAFKPSEWKKTGLPIIRIQNLTGSQNRINYYQGVVEEKYLVENGDILLSWSATLEVFTWNGGNAVLNQHIFNVKPKESTVKEFLPHLFKYHLNKLQNQTHGTGMKHITKGALENINVQIPPLPEQHKIASILSKVDEHISHTEAIIEKTEELKKGLMQQLLTKGIGHTKFKKTEIGEIPEEWDVVKLVDVSLNLLGGGTPSTANNEYWDGSIPWMTSAHINGRYIRSGQKYITQKGLEQSSTKLIPKENILFVTRVGVGKIAINLIDIAISQDITGIIIDKEKANIGFIYWKLLDVARKIVSLSQGSTIKGILKSDLANQNVALPPLSEQTRIANMLMKIETNIEQNQTYLSHLQELKKGLMQDLLTGKVRVTV